MSRYAFYNSTSIPYDLFEIKIKNVIIRYRRVLRIHKGGLQMNWIQKIMYGRYGSDELSFGLVFIYLLFLVIFQFTDITILYIIGISSMVFCIFRMFSKNHQQRYEENQKFLTWWNPTKSKFTNKVRYLKGLKTHRYFKCTSCSQTLRVPKGKGKIAITCPRCKNEFIKKVK